MHTQELLPYESEDILRRLFKAVAVVDAAAGTMDIHLFTNNKDMEGQTVQLSDLDNGFFRKIRPENRSLREIFSESSLRQLLLETVHKRSYCCTEQVKPNVIRQYVLSLYPQKEDGKILVTVSKTQISDSLITLMFKKNAVNLKLEDILYVDYGNHSVEVHTDKGSNSFFSVSFADVADELLKHQRFVRSYKNCIVNMDRVVSTKNDSFLMDNGDRISIPKRRLKQIKRTYEEYRIVKNSY